MREFYEVLDKSAQRHAPTSKGITKAEFREVYTNPKKMQRRIDFIFKGDVPAKIPAQEAIFLVKKYQHLVFCEVINYKIVEYGKQLPPDPEEVTEFEPPTGAITPEVAAAAITDTNPDPDSEIEKEPEVEVEGGGEPDRKMTKEEIEKEFEHKEDEPKPTLEADIPLDEMKYKDLQKLAPKYGFKPIGMKRVEIIAKIKELQNPEEQEG